MKFTKPNIILFDIRFKNIIRTGGLSVIAELPLVEVRLNQDGVGMNASNPL